MKTASSQCDAECFSNDDGTCDRPLCAQCCLHIDPLDLDVCPKHVMATPAPEDCLLFRTYRVGRPIRGSVGRTMRPTEPRQKCKGAILVPHALCVYHAALFGHWLRHADGYDGVYRLRIPHESKRRRFIAWLDQQAPDFVPTPNLPPPQSPASGSGANVK